MPPGKHHGNRGRVGHGLIILAIQYRNFNYILSHSAVLCTGVYSAGYWIPNWRTTKSARWELLQMSRGRHQWATVSLKQGCRYKMSWLTLNPISPHIFRQFITWQQDHFLTFKSLQIHQSQANPANNFVVAHCFLHAASCTCTSSLFPLPHLRADLVTSLWQEQLSYCFLHGRVSFCLSVFRSLPGDLHTKVQRPSAQLMLILYYTHKYHNYHHVPTQTLSYSEISHLKMSCWASTKALQLRTWV